MQTVFPELVATGITADNAEEAIRKIGSLFRENGFVKETYIDAVIKREEVFPTGLQLKDIAIAMPHTDPEHVEKPGVCIVQLDKPVTFAHMGDPETKVEAEMIFMMSILDPNDQLDTLQKVLNVFQQPDVVDQFKKAGNKEELYQTALKFIGEKPE